MCCEEARALHFRVGLCLACQVPHPMLVGGKRPVSLHTARMYFVVSTHQHEHNSEPCKGRRCCQQRAANGPSPQPPALPRADATVTTMAVAPWDAAEHSYQSCVPHSVAAPSSKSGGCGSSFGANLPACARASKGACRTIHVLPAVFLSLLKAITAVTAS